MTADAQPKSFVQQSYSPNSLPQLPSTRDDRGYLIGPRYSRVFLPQSPPPIAIRLPKDQGEGLPWRPSLFKTLGSGISKSTPLYHSVSEKQLTLPPFTFRVM